MNKKTTFTLLLLIVLGAAYLVWQRKSPTPIVTAKEPAIASEQIARTQVSVERADKRASEKSPPAANPSPAVARPEPNSLAIKTRSNAEQIDLIFGDVLGTLNLSPGDLAKVKHLLVERWEAAADTHAVVTADPKTTGGDLQKAWKATEAQIDEELKTAVGESAYFQIKKMQENTTELLNIQLSYVPRFNEAGAPISAEQKLALADVLHQTFAPVDKRRDALTLRTQNIDPATGLSSLDQAVAMKAPRFLTPLQLEVLKTYLAEKTKSMIRPQPETSK